MKLFKSNKTESDVLKSENKNIEFDALNAQELKQITGGNNGGEDDDLVNDLYDWE